MYRILFFLLTLCLSPLVQAQSRSETVYVCFEGKVLADQAERNLRYFETLSELVVDQPGFISRTPYESIDQEGGQVLYVKFDNEEHLHAWKNRHIHLRFQAHGRAEIFTDYRLRIGNEVIDGQSEDDNGSMVSAGKYLLLWSSPTPSNVSANTPEGQSVMAPGLGSDVWQNLIDAATYVSQTHTLHVSSWPNKSFAVKVRDAVPRVDGDDLKLIKVERDYGKYERREAPKDADRCQVAAIMRNKAALKYC